MVVNSYIEALEGRMRLRKFVPQVRKRGKKRNEWRRAMNLDFGRELQAY